jgi:nicotinamidase-related amidase
MPILNNAYKAGVDCSYTYEGGYSENYKNPDEIKPILSKDYIVDNWGTDGFMYSDLELILRARMITDVVAVGVATDWVINSTVRHGQEIGFNMIVVEDCCQTFSEEMHQHQVTHILPQLASAVVKLDEYLAALPKK